MSRPLRSLYIANQTLTGRLVFGPALQIRRTYVKEARRLLRGDTSYAAIWSGHMLMAGALLWLLARCGINPVAYLVFVAYPAASLSLVRSFAEHRTIARSWLWRPIDSPVITMKP